MAAQKRQLALEGKIRFFQPHRNSVEPCRTASTNLITGREEDGSDTEMQELRETDQERRQTMMGSMDASEADQLKTGTLSDIWGGFIVPKRPLDKVTGDDGPRINSQGAKNASMHAPLPPAPSRGTANSESSRAQPGKLPQGQARDEKRVLGQTAWHQEKTLGVTTFSNPKTRGEMARNLRWSCLMCTL